MAKLKFKNKRPELSIAEVLKQYECTQDDIFHAAAEGELTIYMLADGWKIDSIFSYNRRRALLEELEFRNQFEKDPNKYEKRVELRENRMKDDKRIFNEMDSVETFTKPLTNGNWTSYPNSGIYKYLYSKQLYGLQPLSGMSISNFRDGSSNTIILKLIHKEILGDKDEECCALLERDVSIQDALNEGKLFVMKDELQALSSNQSVDPEDAKPEGGVSRKSLLQLVIVMAIKGYGYDINAKKNSAVTDIKVDLERSGASVKVDTIRKALKEAIPLIPSKPA